MDSRFRQKFGYIGSVSGAWSGDKRAKRRTGAGRVANGEAKQVL